jgi:hypothetical protein
VPDVCGGDGYRRRKARGVSRTEDKRMLRLVAVMCGAYGAEAGCTCDVELLGVAGVCRECRVLASLRPCPFQVRSLGEL